MLWEVLIDYSELDMCLPALSRLTPFSQSHMSAMRRKSDLCSAII